MSYQVKWNDGRVRVFDVSDRALAERMAQAYPNLVTEFAKIDTAAIAEPEPVPENKMISPAKDKYFRKRKE